MRPELRNGRRLLAVFRAVQRLGELRRFESGLRTLWCRGPCRQQQLRNRIWSDPSRRNCRIEFVGIRWSDLEQHQEKCGTRTRQTSETAHT